MPELDLTHDLDPMLAEVCDYLMGVDGAKRPPVIAMPINPTTLAFQYGNDPAHMRRFFVTFEETETEQAREARVSHSGYCNDERCGRSGLHPEHS